MPSIYLFYSSFYEQLYFVSYVAVPVRTQHADPCVHATHCGKPFNNAQAKKKRKKKKKVSVFGPAVIFCTAHQCKGNRVTCCLIIVDPAVVISCDIDDQSLRKGPVNTSQVRMLQKLTGVIRSQQHDIDIQFSFTHYYLIIFSQLHIAYMEYMLNERTNSP